MIRSGRPEVILCVHLRGSWMTSWSVCRGCLINGPSAGRSPGCSKVTLTLPQSKRGVSRGPKGTASWHVKAAPSMAALQQTLCNGLFWICISFASHMGSVFPFSLFFFNSVFPSHNNQRFPAFLPLHFSQLALIGFSPADAPSDQGEGAKVPFLFSARQRTLPEGWGRPACSPTSRLFALAPAGLLCIWWGLPNCDVISRWRPGEDHKLLMACVPLLLRCSKTTMLVSERGRIPKCLVLPGCGYKGPECICGLQRVHRDWLRFLSLRAIRLMATAAPCVWLCKECGPPYRAWLTCAVACYQMELANTWVESTLSAWIGMGKK